MHLYLGYSSAIITPTLEKPVFLAGFDRNRQASGVHDPLEMRVVALRQGDTRLVLAALDLIALGRSYCQIISRRLNEFHPGIQLLIACTHTHHGPDTLGLWGPDEITSGVNPTYLESLVEQVVAACQDALTDMKPVALAMGSFHAPDWVKNLRDPNIVDDEGLCVQFANLEDGRPLATWVDFPCHPEVVWNENTKISADYPGYLRQTVAKYCGTPCIFTVGALGGMLSPNVPVHNFAYAERMGSTLAERALKSLEDLDALIDVAPKLRVLRREFRVPLENPLFQMAIDAGILSGEVDAEYHLETETSLIGIGPLWFVAVPGELLPKYGLLMKAALREYGVGLAGIIGLVNDELGYIIPPEDFKFPDNSFESDSHYEETVSVGKQTGPRLFSAFQELLLQAFPGVKEI